ncbi:MAG: glycosyltransferase family 2 protein [Fusobacteriaceae bacterium]
MKENILVSIICLAYNHENVIEDALNGFFKQKVNFNYEILVHEDASTDKTADILKKYQQKYPNLIKVIYQQENQYSKGKSVTANLMSIAEGKYLAFCEGDDFWIDENKLQKQVDFLEKNSDYSATYHNVITGDENKKIIKNHREYNFHIDHIVTKNDIEQVSLGGQTASLVCINFWKNFTEEHKNLYIQTAGNGDMKLSAVLVHLGKVYSFSEIMSFYRRTYNTDSWNSKNYNKNLCYFRFNARMEMKKTIKRIFKVKYNPNVDKYLYSAYYLMKTTSKLEDRDIFFKIIKNYKLLSIKIFVRLFIKKIRIKLNEENGYYKPHWALIENPKIPKEFL